MNKIAEENSEGINQLAGLYLDFSYNHIKSLTPLNNLLKNNKVILGVQFEF